MGLQKAVTVDPTALPEPLMPELRGAWGSKEEKEEEEERKEEGEMEERKIGGNKEDKWVGRGREVGNGKEVEK